MLNFCKYKDLFGKPNTGIHKYRIFDIAIFDVIVVIICSWIIAWFLHIPFWITLAIIFAIGIVIHRLFCVRTGLDQMLFRE